METGLPVIFQQGAARPATPEVSPPLGEAVGCFTQPYRAEAPPRPPSFQARCSSPRPICAAATQVR